MIQFTNVTYHYPQQPAPALRDVSLEIPSGSFFSSSAHRAAASQLCCAVSMVSCPIFTAVRYAGASASWSATPSPWDRAG